MDVIDELGAVVGERNEAVERVLQKIEEELAACRSRCAELEAAASRARLLLDPSAASKTEVTQVPRVTLHEAMRQVLAEAGPEGLSGPELRDVVVSRHLYVGRRGQPPSINQIHARARNYADLFHVEGGRFRLRPS
jgi:hypothetical protein